MAAFDTVRYGAINLAKRLTGLSASGGLIFVNPIASARPQDRADLRGGAAWRRH
jgi:hypothetical protein